MMVGSPARKAGPDHLETVVAKYNVQLSFKIPKGITLEGTRSFWVRYGRLHYYDPNGVEQYIDAEQQYMSDLDFKYPDDEEIICNEEDRLVDYHWRLVRRHVLFRSTTFYWMELPAKCTTATRDKAAAESQFEAFIAKRPRVALS